MARRKESRMKTLDCYIDAMTGSLNVIYLVGWYIRLHISHVSILTWLFNHSCLNSGKAVASTLSAIEKLVAGALWTVHI